MTITRTEVTATLTHVRKDGMQKWERIELDKGDQARYIWLTPNASNAHVRVGEVAKLAFVKGTGGATGGHWATWKVVA